MKKILVAVVLSMAAMSANADCMLSSVRDESIARDFKLAGGWTFPSFEKVCEKLKKANARVQINAASSVLANQSIGWATLTVVDFDTAIGTSDYATYSTQVNGYASNDKAIQLMGDAINAAAENWVDLDKALVALEEERQKVKALYGKKRK